MLRTVCALVCLALISGCEKRLGRVGGPVGALEVKVVGEEKFRTLALEHTIHVEMEPDRIGPAFASAQSACKPGPDEACEILESSIDSGRWSNARLKFRASPQGVRTLIATLGQQGDVVSQSTEAEDLAAPIADVDKKLAMLSDYRAKLEALRTRAAHDVDALIKVNHELAQVQSDLEAAAGTQAHLNKRVKMEILKVFFQTRREQALWRPVADASTGFGEHFAQGVSSVIIGVAVLLPWVALLSVLGWLGRKLWRRSKRQAGPPVNPPGNPPP